MKKFFKGNIFSLKKWNHFKIFCICKIKKYLIFIDRLNNLNRKILGWICIILGIIFFYIPFINGIIFLIVGGKCLGGKIYNKVMKILIGKKEKLFVLGNVGRKEKLCIIKRYTISSLFLNFK